MLPPRTRRSTLFPYTTLFRSQNGDTPTARSGVVVENNERKNSAYSVFLQNRFLFRDWTITPGVRVEHVKLDRKSTRLNSSHGYISYAVSCLKKKTDRGYYQAG